jgi:hypothetical protein
MLCFKGIIRVKLCKYNRSVYRTAPRYTPTAHSPCHCGSFSTVITDVAVSSLCAGRKDVLSEGAHCWRCFIVAVRQSGPVTCSPEGRHVPLCCTFLLQIVRLALRIHPIVGSHVPRAQNGNQRDQTLAYDVTHNAPL